MKSRVWDIIATATSERFATEEDIAAFYADPKNAEILRVGVQLRSWAIYEHKRKNGELKALPSWLFSLLLKMLIDLVIRWVTNRKNKNG